ncbi:HSP20 family protein [Dioscorea alata]|uniref:HSP20 family protein n=1 Tax=Dioscorea alata TaxID=55571 RepID=A0ACB7WWB8_DIOAL|nr:HSP20 family protein [Dioscorea alata]
MSIISFFSRRGSKGDVWDPFDGLPFAASPFTGAQVDWKETPDAHIYIADFPGMKKDEVKVEVEEEKLLKISGQRTRETEEKNDKWHRIERSSDQILRTIKLPPNVNTSKVKATLQNGVLTVTVPKDQDMKAVGRIIEISG